RIACFAHGADVLPSRDRLPHRYAHRVHVAAAGAVAAAVVDDDTVSGPVRKQPGAGVAWVRVGTDRRDRSSACGVEGGALGVGDVGSQMVWSGRGSVAGADPAHGRVAPRSSGGGRSD